MTITFKIKPLFYYFLIFQEIGMMMSNSNNIENNTHNYRNVYISFEDKVRSTDVETYLKRHLSDFYKNSRFVILCGIHSFDNGEIGHSDSNLVADYQSMFENVITDYKDQCQQKCENCKQCQKSKLWKERNFKMGTVMPIFSKKNMNGKYVLLEGSVNSINERIEDLMDTKLPHVFIFASCYSVHSEINHLMRSRGLLSVLSMTKERGDITCGRIFLLDEVQKSLLKKIIKNPERKDTIVGG